MTIRLHPHAVQRIRERGASQTEVIQTVRTGRQSPAKYGRRRFRKTFPFDSTWNNKRYALKQIDAYAVRMRHGWFVVTVIVKYF